MPIFDAPQWGTEKLAIAPELSSMHRYVPYIRPVRSVLSPSQYPPSTALMTK